tara:strand:- start:1763 stop:2221 length:459 start_codon:yes stop_codon:yes gene_type:complete
MILETTALLCLSANIYFEARGEDIAGQIAIAEVTMNRVSSENYPNDICQVVLQQNSDGCQFSWWCDNKPDIVQDDFAFQRAKALAEMYLKNGEYISVVGGEVTHYHTRNVSPYWKKDFEWVISLGNHIFYRPYKKNRPITRPKNFIELLDTE